MTPQLHPTLSAVLGKAKVGGLVLAATVLVAGTAEAATGSDLFGDDPAPVVQEDGTTDPVTDPCVTPPDDGSDPVVEEPVDGDPADVTGTDEPVTEPTDDGTVDPCEEPVDDGTDDGTDEGTDDDGTDEQPVDEACATARNHGEYVSGVAHETPPGPGHGAAVSEAARSDCGKKGASDGGDDDGADATAKDTDGGSAHVPPGQAKKDDASGDAGAPSSAPGNSGNAPGHSGDSSSGGAPGNSGNAPGHNK